jgi:hypothetical protein
LKAFRYHVSVGLGLINLFNFLELISCIYIGDCCLKTICLFTTQFEIKFQISGSIKFKAIDRSSPQKRIAGNASIVGTQVLFGVHARDATFVVDHIEVGSQIEREHEAGEEDEKDRKELGRVGEGALEGDHVDADAGDFFDVEGEQHEGHEDRNGGERGAHFDVVVEEGDEGKAECGHLDDVLQ